MNSHDRMRQEWEQRRQEKSEARTYYHGLMLYTATICVPVVALVLILGHILQPLVMVAICIGAIYIMTKHEDWYRKVVSMMKNGRDEKVEKLAKAIGLKWQIVPERRRWVTKDTPEPEHEDEQPQLMSVNTETK